MTVLNAISEEFDVLAALDFARKRTDARLGVANNNRKPHGSSVVNWNDPTAIVPTVLNASEFEGKDVPSREWIVRHMIPARTVTLLSGDGGVGKSLLALQLACSVALPETSDSGKKFGQLGHGVRWAGQITEHGNVLYVSAEDETDELHRRLADIAAAEGFSLADLDGLSIVPLAGESAILAGSSGRRGALAATSLWNWLVREVESVGPKLIVLDTCADFFGGNEIDRGEVRQFLTLLRGLALKADCAILLLSHPSVAGMNTGTGLSGSTAWNNSVRSRLYFTVVKNESGDIPDPDARLLMVMKANYGKNNLQIRMRWADGRFAVDDTLATGDGPPGVDRNARADEVFLALLALLASQDRYVSPKPSASYAPTVFAKHAKAEGFNKRDFTAAMDRLFEAARIKVETTGPLSRQVTRIVATPSDAPSDAIQTPQNGEITPCEGGEGDGEGELTA